MKHKNLLKFSDGQFQRTDNGLCIIVCMTPASLGIFSTLLYKIAHGRDGSNKQEACPIAWSFHFIIVLMHFNMLFLMFCRVVVAVLINGGSHTGTL